MSNWEDKYYDYSNGTLDKKIDELTQLVDSVHGNIEQYNELTKCKRIQSNMDKIGNLLEYKNKLESFLDDIDIEINKRESLKDVTNQVKELDVEMKKIEMEYKKVEQKLENSNLSSEEKEKLELRRQKILSEKNENNKKYGTKQEELAKHLNSESELNKKTDNQLNALAIEVSSRISKCNMVGKNLLNGKSWDYIEYKLDNFKEPTKYIPGKERPNKVKEIKEPQNATKNSSERIMKKFMDIINQDDHVEDNHVENDHVESNNKANNDGNNSKIDYEEYKPNEKVINNLSVSFDKKHPKLAKVAKFFGNIKDKIRHLFRLYNQDDYLNEWQQNVKRDIKSQNEDGETKLQEDDYILDSGIEIYDASKDKDWTTEKTPEEPKKVPEANEEKIVEDHEGVVTRTHEEEPKKTPEANEEKIAEEYEKVVTETPEKITEKDLMLENKDFRTLIKELADKGFEGLSEEEKIARKKASEEKLAKMRAANRANEAKKFGQKYADQSDFRNKDVR